MNRSFLSSYLSSLSQKRLAQGREPKLLTENIDLKVEYYIAVVDEEWPLPKEYWFGNPKLEEDMAEIEYEWQTMKSRYGL